MAHQPFNQALLPRFQEIDPDKIEPIITNMLKINRERLKALLAQSKSYTWDNLMKPLEDMSDELTKIWSPVSHLRSVVESDALRKAYNQVLPLLTEYSTEFSQNEQLFRAIDSLQESEEFNKLDSAQKKIIENDIRDFKLAGVNLPPDKKERMAKLQKQLSQLTTKFSENVLDATQAWTLHVTDRNQLEGLPPQALQLAADNAKQRNLEGYVLTLDYP